MAVYQLFVDDSGNREYADNRVYEKTGGKSRYFVYGAVLLEQRQASLLVTRLRELKVLVFGTADVEVKCNWLRLPGERQRRYLQRFAVTEPQLTRFTDDYYRLIDQAPLDLIASVVDKLHMQENYGAGAWYAPTVAYDVLMQRAVQAVPSGSSLSVTVDDISGKTPKHHEYKELLSKHHRRLLQRGSSLQPSISFGCLSGPVRFTNSSHSDLIQVADLAAYNVHRQFRDYGTEWETSPRPGAVLPTYPYFERISAKFRKDANGRVRGFGIVKIPLRKRVIWRVKKKE
jgi:Protein of unknown function (DUF3800)